MIGTSEVLTWNISLEVLNVLECVVGFEEQGAVSRKWLHGYWYFHIPLIFGSI